MKKVYFKQLALLVLVIYSLFVFSPFVPKAWAVDFTEASVRLDRMAASTEDPGILIVAKPASTATEAKVVITFSSGFTVDSTANNITTSTTGIPSNYQGDTLNNWVTIGATATSVDGQAITFSSGDLTADTLYGFYITGGVDNPSSANTYSVTIKTATSGDTEIDTKTVAVDIITNDQVTVTASVPSTFNFTLSGNSIALGEQSTSAIDTGNITIDVDTNAASGYIAWVKSTNTYLLSASTSDQINTKGSIDGTPETCSAGTECYNLAVAGTKGGSSVGTITEALEYAGNGTTTAGTLGSAFQEIATSNGAALDDTLTLTVLVAITGLNKAATDYTDTLTVVGAGNF